MKISFLLCNVFLLLVLLAGCKEKPEPPGNTALAYKLHGLCFSPYKDGQSPDLRTPISEQQIIELLNKAKPYTNWIRTYGATDGLEKIGINAHNAGLKVAGGAWLGKDMASNQTQIDNLIAAGKANQIDLAIVGSEVLFRGDLTQAQLVAYINQVKTALPGIPITTADVHQHFLSSPEIVNAVDMLFIHIYPYWEGISLTCATNFINNVYDKVKEKAQGKEVVVAETGWPSAGNTVGNAVPSAANASAYFLNFISWAKAKQVKYFYFEFMDEQWKQVNEGPQGAHWGIFAKNGGDLKPGMNQVFEGKMNPDNWLTDTTVLQANPPTVSFTFVPKLGSFENLKGVVKGVIPFNYRIAVFIYVNGWWNKPSWTQPLTVIQCDGSFVCDITTGGIDERATRIRAYVVAAGYSPPQLTGHTALPASVENNAVARIEVLR